MIVLYAQFIAAMSILLVSGIVFAALLWSLRTDQISQQGVSRVSDWPGVTDAAPYVWTGGAGVIGRLMFHAKQVQQGKRKPLTWALLFDLPIALAMGWIVYGLCVWARLEAQPTISAAIAASYLGPYSVDRLFTAWATKVGGEKVA